MKHSFTQTLRNNPRHSQIWSKSFLLPSIAGGRSHVLTGQKTSHDWRYWWLMFKRKTPAAFPLVEICWRTSHWSKFGPLISRPIIGLLTYFHQWESSRNFLPKPNFSPQSVSSETPVNDHCWGWVTPFQWTGGMRQNDLNV